MDDLTVMVAQSSAVVAVDGTRVRVRQQRTTAHAGAPVVRQHPDLWGPLHVDFPAASGRGGAGDEDGPAGGAGETSPAGPSAKAVRAWARSAGVAVPARGRIPDDVVAAYQAAQEN